MKKSYIIQWKSKLNGRTGKGTRLLDWDGAAELADELNQEYPDIEHEAVEVSLVDTPPAAHEQTAAGSEASQPNLSPDYAFSFE
jgi:hypothetical protein